MIYIINGQVTNPGNNTATTTGKGDERGWSKIKVPERATRITIRAPGQEPVQEI